jgi:hypothetical protein
VVIDRELQEVRPHRVEVVAARFICLLDWIHEEFLGFQYHLATLFLLEVSLEFKLCREEETFYLLLYELISLSSFAFLDGLVQ